MRRFTGASTDTSVEARLEEILHHLYGFYHVEIDLSLDRTYRFLERLGNPHLNLPPVVHIAGTNGKGSTTATLRALLEASGHTVHVYTSPHLVHPTERIRLTGKPIASQALINVLTECIEINDGEPITFFEIFTCAAFLAFSRVKADWLILETGMGGRLDTTNVVPDPALTLITTISYDHQKFLGDTLPAIAAEKAGILKPGVPCVVGYQIDEAIQAGVMEVIQKTSQGLSPPAPLVRWGAEWCTAPEAGLMLFRYEDDSILTRRPVLAGNHQLWNAGAALAAFRTIAPGHFTPHVLSTALGRIDWPGRLQTLENHPYNNLVPPRWDILIDGGHNDSAGQVLAQVVQEWADEIPARSLHLIIAMVNRKDAGAFLAPLQPYAASITLTEIEGEATTYQKEVLADKARDLGFKNIYTASTPEDAVRSLATREAGPDVRVLIAGSLFLMGNILRAFD
jgi:dihydrofolate synthase/folylpolyglutamate synthase